MKHKESKGTLCNTKLKDRLHVDCIGGYGWASTVDPHRSYISGFWPGLSGGLVDFALEFQGVLVGIGQGIGGYCWVLPGYRWVLVASFDFGPSFSPGKTQKTVCCTGVLVFRAYPLYNIKRVNRETGGTHSGATVTNFTTAPCGRSRGGLDRPHADRPTAR